MCKNKKYLLEACIDDKLGSDTNIYILHEQNPIPVDMDNTKVHSRSNNACNARREVKKERKQPEHTHQSPIRSANVRSVIEPFALLSRSVLRAGLTVGP